MSSTDRPHPIASLARPAPMAANPAGVLRWCQTRPLSRHYELRAGDDALATLKFRSRFGSLATGQSGDGCWTFKRVGFVSTRVTVRACGSDRNLALFRNNCWAGGGTLELLDRRRFHANSNAWQTRFEIRDEHEETLVSFKRVRGLRLTSDVVVHVAGETLPELPWVVILGWYLTVMQHGDAAIIT